MSPFLRRHPLGRLLHQCLVWTLIVAMTDANAQTLTGSHFLHGAQVLVASSGRDFRDFTPQPISRGTYPNTPVASTPTTPPARSVAFNSPSFLANLALPSATSSPRSTPSRTSPTPGPLPLHGGTQLLRLAQATGSPVLEPSDPACFDAVARPKPGKVQVDWSPVAWASRYEIYRGSDTDPVLFQKVGDAASNLATFLDASVPNEQTYLYFVRAIGVGASCDSSVASAHPTTRRGTFNYPPVIYSRPVTQGLVGVPYRYHLRASDPYPGDPVRYEVVEGPEGMAIDPNSGWVEWQATVGAYPVTLLADDGRGGTDLQSFVLQVLQPNRPPIADPGLTRAVHVTTLVTLDGSRSTDPDNDPLSFVWSLVDQPAGGTAVLTDPESPQPSFVPNQIGTYRLQLIVHDGKVPSEPAWVEVVAGNTPPVANAGLAANVPLNATVRLDGSRSSDADGDPITYRWSILSRPAGSTASLVGETQVQPSFTADRRGEFVLELIVHDGFENSAPSQVTITVDNTPPLANAGTDTTVPLNATVTLDGSGSSDVDGDPLQYRWSLVSQPPGSNARLVGETSVRPTFTADQRGEFIAELIVHDGTEDSAPDRVTISTVNSIPVAHAGPDQTAPVLTTVTLDGSLSSDPDNDPLTCRWSVVSQPIGSAIALSDATAGQPTFQILVPGNYVFELIVHDGYADSVADSVTVSTVNSRPVAKAGDDLEVRAGTLVRLDGTGSSDVDKDPLTYAWSMLSTPDPNLPVAFDDPTSPTPTFLATQVGVHVVQLIIHDGATNSEPDTLTVTVVPALVAVPDVVGMPQAQAESTLVNATLAVGTITTAHHATVPAGRVISQAPVAGTLVEPGTAVVLVISLGPPLVAVPDVVGELEADAEQRITAATLTVGEITRVFHPTVPLGRVLQQDPVGGTLVLPATSVALVVSLGPEVLCAFAPGEFAQWQTTVAPVPEGKTLGSVAPASSPECALILREGDSFEVTAQRTFTLPAEPGMLVIAYETPSFDTTATGAMRDAFEVALVDGAGRPLTFTIQGNLGLPPVAAGIPAPLPPSPDALFNHTEGLPTFVAAGASYVPGPTNTLAIDLRSLAPGSNARLILRLVNNDGDVESAIRIRDVRWDVFNGGLGFGGSPDQALSTLLGRSDQGGGASSEVSGAVNGTTSGCDPAITGLPRSGPVPKIVVGAPSPSGFGTIKVFQDRNEFLVATQAEDATGPLPDLGLIPGGAAGMVTLGQVTLTISSPSSELYVGTQGTSLPDWTARNPGPDIAISDIENLNIALGAPVYSLGFDFVEPEFDEGYGPFIDSTFQVQLKRGGTVVEAFEFNAPNDTPTFVGVWSREPFDRVEIRETTGGIDDEFFGRVYAGLASPPAASTPHGPTLAITAPADQLSTPIGTTILSGYALAQTSVGAVSSRSLVSATYFGEDVSAWSYGGLNAVPRPVIIKSTEASASEFRSRLPGVQSHTFEDHGNGDQPTDILFGTNVARLSGGREILTIPDHASTFNGIFPVSGTNVLILKADRINFFNLDFPTPQAAFGFYGNDVGEPLGLGLGIVSASGARTEIDVPITKPQGSGGSFFFGIVSPLNPFTRIEFQAQGTTEDWFGFDDFTIGTADQVAPPTVANRIVRVTVNGSLVDALDLGGNFFSLIQIQPGRNVFEVVATDALEQSTTNTIEVFGTTCIESFASLGEASTVLSPEYGRTSFNDWTEVLYSELAVRNTGLEAIGTPLYVGVTRISGAGVDLLAPDGVTADGVPFYDFSAAVSSSTLAPGSVSAARTLAFSNPNRTQFTYELVILGRRNQPPTITSLPTVTATANRAYNYDADATDPDNDPLTYTLESGPSGLAIAPSNGVLTWSPSDSDLGTHDITLRVEDGRGGSADQRYVLSVTAPPANRPPYYTSNPVLAASISTIPETQGSVMSMTDWELVKFDTTSQNGTQAEWRVDAGGTSVTQLHNAEASAFVSREHVSDVTIRGKLRVGSDADDDWLGFVFGYQDPYHFYLLSWAKGGDNNVPGLRLGRVSSRRVPTDSDIGYLNDDENVKLLFESSTRWLPFRTYDFELEYRQDGFQIIVSEEGRILDEIRINDAAYPSGRFGFFNFSQDSVTYQGFIQRKLPNATYEYDVDAMDPDGDVVSYRLLPANTYAAKVNIATPVGYWGLDERTGTALLDQSGHALHATLNGDVALGVDGVLAGEDSSAALFRGGYASVADNHALRSMQISLEAWVFPVSMPNWATVVMKSTDSSWNDGFGFAHYTGTDDIHFFVDGYRAGEVAGALALNSWSHLVGTYDGSSVRFYINGELVATKPYALDIRHSMAPLRIGSGAGGYPWSGAVDEVAVYDRALDAVTVRAHYLARSNSGVIAPPGMSINPISGLVRWVPSQGQIGSHPVGIEAQDGRGGAAIQRFVINVLPPIGNRPPEIVSEPVVSVYAGSIYRYPVVALDPDGDELAFTLIEGPSGMTVRPSNGAVEWTVPGAESGPWPVKVRVTDGKGGQGEQVYAIGLVAPGRGEIHGTVYNDTNLDGLPTHPRSVELRFDSLPSTQGWTYRAQGGGVPESQVFSTTGISLVQNSVGTGSVGRGYLMYSYDSLMEPLLPFEISFRAKVLEVEDLNRVSPINHFGFHVGLQAGPNWYGIGIGPDVVVHQKSVRGVGEYGVLANLDVSDFHDYRVKATPGDAFQLSIDGFDVTTVQPLVYIQPFALTLGDTTAGENARAEVVQYRFTQFPEDPGVVGHLVYIDSNSNGVRDREEPSAATGTDGSYAFTGLLPGVHTVRYERTPGWTPVMPASGVVSVTITAGEVVRDVDFLIGRIPAGTGELRGAVFVDLNRDGVRGAVSPRTGSVDVTKEKILLLTGNGEPNSVGPVLQSLGYSVVVRSLNPGSLVAVLGSDPSFTQVWVWNDGTYGNSVVPPDVSRSFSAEDLRALSTFSKTHDKWIMDGLSWRKHLTQDEGNLTKNEALNLSIAGGGVVLGADDSPIPNAIVQHVNQVAAYFGFDLFAGVYDTPPSIQSKGGSLFGSPYLVNANALNSSTTTYSEIPHGFQQNGVFLATALFGSPATPSPGYGSLVLAGDVIGGVSYEHVNHLVTTSIPGGGLDGVPEPGLSGWIVYLDEDDNGRRDAGEAFAITDGSGSYAFLSLASGTYVVRQEPKRGWRLDAPASGEHEVSLGVGEKVFGLDFANTELPFGPGNLPPLLASVPPGVAVHGSRYLYRPVATDGDGDVLAFELVTKPSGMVLEPSSGITVWRPDSTQVGTHDVVLRVQDGRGGVDVQAWQIQVVHGNTAPVITTVPPSPAVADVAYQYEVRAQDAENDEITLSLASGPAGMTLESAPPPAVLPPGLTWSATAGVRWTPSSAQIGDHPVVVLATDARGAESLQSFTLFVVATAPNDPPVFTSTPRRTVRAGTPYVYVVAASDPNGDLLEFRTPTLPSGMTLESTGSALSRELQWSPTPAQIGSHPVKLEVGDGRGGLATQSFTLDVVTEAFNGSPIITSIAKTSAVVDRVYAYNATAEDPDADPVIWELVTGPAGMSIDVRRGAIRWNPTLDALGTHPVTLRVTDPLGATGEQSFDLQVRAANQPPAIVSFPLTEATVGELYLYGVRATDGEGDTLTFRIVTGPVGASLATVPGTTPGTAVGNLSWTPTLGQVGFQTVIVEANDGNGGVASQNFVVLVTDQPKNRPPTITSIPVTTARPEQPYQYEVRASDPDGGTLNFQLVTAPAGMTLGPRLSATGIPVLWTPTSSQVGAHDVAITALDAQGAGARQRFTVTVRANQAPLIQSTPPTTVLAGTTYRYGVRAVDPDGDRLRYELTAGPAGMAVDAYGVMSWSTAATGAGTHPVRVQVSDPYGATVSQVFEVAVQADTQAPTVTLQITASMSDDQGRKVVEIQKPVRIRATAADNVAVQTLRLHAGGEERVLDANGETTVTFTSPAFVDVVAAATDAAGKTGTAQETIRVVDLTASGSPVLTIESPSDDDTVTQLTPVRIRIRSAAPLVDYVVEYATASDVDLSNIAGNNAAFTLLRRVTLPADTREVPSVEAAVFDPTMLLNDSYLIRVTATDINNRKRIEGVLVHVQGNLKFGEFRLEFTDLAVPVAGIPIQITRVYDSRLSKRSGDFGHGWSLGVRDAQIRETLRQGTFYPGTRVYLNAPDGRRIGFTVRPELVGSFGFTFVKARFTPDPGVYDKLEIIGDPTAVFHQGLFLGGLGDEDFNPSQYRLTTKDGTVYDYDQSAGLQQVVDSNANRLVLTRDGVFHYLSGETTPDQSIPFTRDARGRITQITDPAGNALRYSYDAAGDLRTFTDQEANVTQYGYDTTRPHFLASIIDPLGRQALTVIYDATGRLESVVDASGNPIQQALDTDTNIGTLTDARGNQTFLHYDDQGNEIARIVPGISTNRFEFDANNNLLRGINARGGITNFTYDAQGNVTSITDPSGATTTMTYNSQGKPTKVVNALGQTLALQYNSAGQLLEVINNAGHRTAMTRDGQGRVTRLTDAAGNTTQFEYDGGCSCGRPGKVINPDGSFRLYEYTSQGQTNRVVNELGAEARFDYDSTGRLLSTRDALGNETRFLYRGPLLTNIVDALGRSTRYEYDAQNRTNKIIDAEGGVVEFRYDANGNRTHVIDPVRNVTEFVYDADNRLVQQIDPLGHISQFAYDAAGNRIEAIDRNGRRRTFEYDDMNRMTHERWWEGNNVVRTLEYAFNALGVQTLASDPAARYEYQYDTLNRLTRVAQTQVPGQADFTLAYAYTPFGQVASVTDNWGVRVGSEYNNRGLLARRTWQGPGIDPARVDFSYDPTGNRTRLDRFADLAGSNRIGFTTNGYNRAGIVTNITHLGPAAETLAQYDYTFDVANQIVQWTINGQPSVFGYDLTGQLTNAVHAAQPNEAYRYDANGNRIGAQPSGSYTVGGNNQILSDGTHIYGYDNEGNMTARSNVVTGATTEYYFDHRNRLVEVLDRDGVGQLTQSVAFGYDANNRRLRKSVNGEVIRFVYNHDDSWADLDAAGVVTARYLHGAKIDELMARSRLRDGNAWYLGDHLGSIRDIGDGKGLPLVRLSYDDFGNPLAEADTSKVDRFQFTGREYDVEVGLYHYRARAYAPQLGRFVSVDPIGFDAGDWNLYRYALGNPIRFSDPTGQSVTIEFTLMISFTIIGGYLLAHTPYGVTCVAHPELNIPLSQFGVLVGFFIASPFIGVIAFLVLGGVAKLFCD